MQPYQSSIMNFLFPLVTRVLRCPVLKWLLLFDSQHALGGKMKAFEKKQEPSLWQ